MTTLLAPSGLCFAHRGAASFLRPLVRAPKTHPASCSTLLVTTCTAPSRSISTRSPSSGAFPRSSSYDFSRTPRLRFGLSTRRHKSKLRDAAETVSSRWTSRVWKDGYEPNYIIAEYEKIPSTYSDEEGLPFSSADLTPTEVRNLFGSSMGAASGNRLLRILHGRRVAGTLNHPEYFPNTQEYSPKSISVGLSWLRKTIPVDETLNGALRAEEELAQIELEQQKEQGESDRVIQIEVPKEYIPDSHKFAKKKGKKELAKKAQKAAESEPEPTYEPDPIYGYSPVDELRFQKQQQAKKMETKQEEERKAKLKEKGLKPEEIGTLMALDPNKIHLPQFPSEMSPRMKEAQKKGMITQLEEPPEIPLWARLLPSTMFAFSLLGFIFMGEIIYSPPRMHERLLPDLPVAVATIIPIVAVTVAIWGAWHIPRLYNFMNRFFLVVPAMPRPASILFSAFSHQSLAHMLPNTAALVLLGVPLCDRIGRGDFLSILFAAAIIGNLSSLWLHVLTKAFHTATHGISSVVCALWTMYFYLARDERFRFGIPKEVMGLPSESDPGIPGSVFIVLFMIYNAMFIFKHRSIHQVDAANHWAGILVGFAAGRTWEYKQEFKRRRRKERQTLLAANPGVLGVQDAPGAVEKTGKKAAHVAKKVDETVRDEKGD
ncbi:rhomboid [Zalerion maritima]|uniref:Rhomboid n=1 Tax=Zalerion maritima TaxID=339359 RepID=A0AAD5WRN8_9PEZI|nr:rhomboid [Zalerion maritima]